MILRDAACLAFPRLTPIVRCESLLSRSTWNAPLKTGKALEFLTLTTLLGAAEAIGCKVNIPTIFDQLPSLYYLRNELPHHHNAQPGHSASHANDSTLRDRFLASLYPRATIENANKVFSVFREGCVYHLIDQVVNGRPEYHERPDILLCEGQPVLDLNGTSDIDYHYESHSGDLFGTLRVKNQSYIPLKHYDHEMKSGFPVCGIVECSISKTATVADEQIDRYVNIFRNKIYTLVSLLVNGEKAKSKYSTKYINLKGADINVIVNDLIEACVELIVSSIQ